MISGISRQNNTQARPAFGARQVTGPMSDIDKVWNKIINALDKKEITDAYGLNRIDLVAEKRQKDIHTFIFGVNNEAEDLKKFGVAQSVFPVPNYLSTLKSWCGHVVDLSKPAQKAEDLLKEMEASRFDYSKL